jgi:hypothetical protein
VARTETIEKTWLQQVRHRVRPRTSRGGYRAAREGEDTDVFLVGTARRCQCYDDAPIHLLRLVNEPESLKPVCGAGRDRWCHDNQEGELDDVTCQRCVQTILKNMTETEKKRWGVR